MTTPQQGTWNEDDKSADQRVRGAGNGGERETLAAFLDWYRQAIVRKLRGVSDDDARRSTLPTVTSLGGVVKHLRWVEQGWFRAALDGIAPETLPRPSYSDDDPDADLRMEADETLEGLVADYLAQCELSREVCSRHQLDEVVPHPRVGDVSMRWIVVHMIEETARHAGHVDILREQLDGVVGD